MSRICHVYETCSCGASVDFTETLPSNAYPHDHNCQDVVRKFREAHEKCKGAES